MKNRQTDRQRRAAIILGTRGPKPLHLQTLLPGPENLRALLANTGAIALSWKGGRS